MDIKVSNMLLHTTSEQVLEYIKTHPNASTSDVARTVGFRSSRSTIKGLIRRLEDKGAIHRTTSKGANAILYRAGPRSGNVAEAPRDADTPIQVRASKWEAKPIQQQSWCSPLGVE